MPTPRELEQTIANLPLSDRKTLLLALEQSISNEYVDITEAHVAADAERSEDLLTQRPLTPYQMLELQSRVEAAESGDAHYVPWEHVRTNILCETSTKRMTSFAVEFHSDAEKDMDTVASHYDELAAGLGIQFLNSVEASL